MDKLEQLPPIPLRPKGGALTSLGAHFLGRRDLFQGPKPSWPFRTLPNASSGLGEVVKCSPGPGASRALPIPSKTSQVEPPPTRLA